MTNYEWNESITNYEWKDSVHFQPVEMTGANMSVLIQLRMTNYELRMAEGEIGVFTEAGLCVGAVTLASSQQVSPPSVWLRKDSGETPVKHAAGTAALQGIAVWADDPTTTEVDGAVEGEALSFRVWDGRVETLVSPIWDGEDGHFCLSFSTDGFSAGKIEERQAGMPVLPTAFALHSAFPNPFNSTTLIRFDLPQSSRVSLIVTDLAGREVADLSVGLGGPTYAAGSHSVTWNATNFVSGLYFVKLEAGVKTMTQKVMLVK